MNSDALLGRDRGVSPIIAVILMTAITVILASVVGAFVLDVGDSLQSAPPQVAFEAEQSPVTLEDDMGATKTYTAVNITHSSGEPVDPDNLKVTVDGEPAYGWSAMSEPDPYDEPRSFSNQLRVIRPGDRYDMINAGDTIRVFMATTFWQEVGGEIGVHDFRVHSVHAPTFEFHSYYNQPPGWGSHPKTAGNEVKSGSLDEELESGQLLRVVYDSPQGSSQILYEYEIT